MLLLACRETKLSKAFGAGFVGKRLIFKTIVRRGTSDQTSLYDFDRSLCGSIYVQISKIRVASKEFLHPYTVQKHIAPFKIPA